MTASTKTHKTTWVDWLLRGGVDMETIEQTSTLTRDELIQRLSDGGIKVSAYDLENWQQAGIIPYGIRRRHHGARVLYPWWMVDIIRSLRTLQSEASIPLSRISPRLNIQALQLAQHRDELPAPTAPPELEGILRRWATQHSDIYGFAIPRVDVSLIDERGHPLTFRFDTSNNSAEE